MRSKALFIGGIRSGKSKSAQEYILKRSSKKPLYLATNELFDEEMQQRVAKHKESRLDTFITHEEPLHLYDVIAASDQAVLVECISMWINNMLYHGLSEAMMVEEIEKILQLDREIVFVVNDVGSCVVSENRLVREFVDINGRIAQLLASGCDEVYHVVAGISVAIK